MQTMNKKGDVVKAFENIGWIVLLLAIIFFVVAQLSSKVLWIW